MAGIKPLPGFVLIEPIEEENVSAGGVYVPETSKDKPMKGKLIASSDIFTYQGDVLALSDVTLEKAYKPLKIGSTVIYKKWTNQEVQHEGKDYLLVHFSELLAVIE